MAGTFVSYSGRAIGRLATRLSGLNAIYLPSDATAALGAAIVREANLQRPVHPPYAILIGEGESSDQDLPVVTRAESIRYRQGDRLAVVPASSVDLASFDGAFREVLGSGFPETALQSFDVTALARELLLIIADESAVDDREIPADELSSVLARCLRAVADILVMEQEGSAVWNAKWFAAIDHGVAALVEAVQSAGDSGRFATFTEAVTAYVWAAFGLPRPANGVSWKKRNKASDFVASLQDVWSSEEAIDLYTKEMVLTGGEEAAALERCSQIGWDGLDDQVVGTASGLLGLQAAVSQNADRFQSFSEVSEDSFLRAAPTGRDLVVVDRYGVALSLSPTQPTVSLLSSSEGSDGQMETEAFTVVATAHSVPPEELVQLTKASVRASSGAQIAALSGPVLIGQQVHFEVALRLKQPKAFGLKKLGLSLEVGAQDPLYGYLRSAAVAVHIAPPIAEGVVVAEWNNGKRSALRSPRYEGSSSTIAPDQTYNVELKPDKHYRVVVWSEGPAPVASGFELEGLDGRPGWFVGDLLPNYGGSLRASSTEWTFSTGAVSEAPHSLLLAAIDKARVNPEDPDVDVMESLRGQLESFYAAQVEDDDFASCLGHMVLPEESTGGPLAASGRHRGLLMTSVTADFWDAGVGMSAEIPESGAVHDAHEAFIDEWRSCVTRAAAEPGQSNQWPSKRSLRHLANDGSIDRLLNRYVDLVEACSDLDELVRFRAAYPFSVSIWTQATWGVECTAVLLSPWHPIRMAWLAQTEEVLWGAERARELAGVVEGWRFPMVGPGRAEVDRMVAVPIDTGADQIFVGWSMVVLLATGKTLHLKPPSRAAGLPMPGSAPSGLTGSAADAAMRDFMRANQHLPSVTIDLASSASGQRLSEIDASVIRAVRDWSKREQPLLGVRVLDQLTREGDLPRDLLSGLFKDDLKTSVSWSRYPAPLNSATSASRPRSNLRLLQDSGVQMGHIPRSGRTGGVLAGANIRRFETSGAPDAPTSIYLEPGVPDDTTAFTQALRALEGADQPPRIRLQTAISALLNDASDWTISGESFLSPTALAHMISHHGGSATDRMLWEWRPPFLRPSKEESPLGRRPYVTIARVAGSLVDQVTAQVKGIYGDKDASEVKALVDDIFRTLGTRGIGLSSLLSMGGQHASGALGFYLALRLMGDMPIADEGVQVVLPLDSCQSFLDAMAPDSGVTDSRRRADLLVVRVIGDEAVLSPVEIKFYGASGDGGPLPSPGHEFVEPIQQLEATVSLLRKMQSERYRLRSGGLRHDATLWDASLATLFEAGLRLSPSSGTDPESVRGALERLAQRDLTVSVGRPLVLFFKHQADAGSEMAAYREGSLQSRDIMSAYGALAVRPRFALEELSGAAGDNAAVLSEWSQLVEWSIEHRVPEGGGDPGGARGHTGGEETDDLSSDDESELGARFEADLRDVPAGSRTVVEFPSDSSHSTSIPSAPPSVEADDQERFQTVYSPPPPPPPVRSLESQVQAEEKKIEPVQDINYGVRFPVGEFRGALSGSIGEYWPGNSETTQLNMGIVGDLGTGKTQLLKALILNLRRSSSQTQDAPVDCLVFDYKCDFQDDGFTKAVRATVWRPSRMPLNVLDLHEPYSAAAAFRRAAAFTTMLERIYKGVGPVQRERLIGVIMDLYEYRKGEAPTLGEVLDAYREQSSGDSVTSILSVFVLGEIFTENRREVISLEEAMKDTVLVIDLNSLGADSYTKNAIVVFFLDMFYERMKRMSKVPPRLTLDGVTVRNITSYLLVDEASNIMKYKFDVLDSLLKEGREFGVGTILSSQYLSHFKIPGANYAETLSTWFIHKVPNATHTELSSLGIKDANFDMAESIRGLKVHESLYRSDLSRTRFIREIPFWQLISEDGSAH